MLYRKEKLIECLRSFMPVPESSLGQPSPEQEPDQNINCKHKDQAR